MTIVIHNADYVGSYVDYQKGPEKRMMEFAFIGRSNVGKSSLINSLTGRKDLAKVSKMPGKTQTINFFNVNDQWYLVDLPGYGYAKHSKKTRARWDRMIQDYLVKRKQLVTTFILVDSNIPAQKIDLEFINWLGSKQLPFTILFTKCDRSKKEALLQNVAAYNKQLSESWEPLPKQIVTSAHQNVGKEELLLYISELVGSLNYES